MESVENPDELWPIKVIDINSIKDDTREDGDFIVEIDESCENEESDLQLDYDFCASCKCSFPTAATHKSVDQKCNTKVKEFQSFNSVTGELKEVSVLEAFVLLFDLKLLKTSSSFVKTIQVAAGNLGLCSKCAIIVSQLYKLYSEFFDLIEAGSTLSQLINREHFLQSSTSLKNKVTKPTVSPTRESAGVSLSEKSFSVRETTPLLPTNIEREETQQTVEASFVPHCEEYQEQGDSYFERDIKPAINQLSQSNRKFEWDSSGAFRNDVTIKTEIDDFNPRITSVSSYASPPKQLVNPRFYTSKPTLNSRINSSAKSKNFNTSSLMNASKTKNVLNSHSNNSKQILISNRCPSTSTQNFSSEASECSSSSSRPRRRTCKRIDYSKFGLGEDDEDDGDANFEVTEDDEDADANFEDEYADLNVDEDDDDKVDIKPFKNGVFKLTAFEKQKFASKRNNNSKKCREMNKLMQPATCHYCAKIVSNGYYLRDHIALVHNNGQPFPCLICGKTFGQKTHANAHLLTHIPEKSFVCNSCNEMFKTRNEREAHMKSHTTSSIVLTCKKCQECFPSIMLLNRHEASVHQKLKIFICPMCAAVCFQRDKWVQHILSHAPFLCSLCELYFHPGEMKLHMQTMHPNPVPQLLRINQGANTFPNRSQPQQSLFQTK